MSSSSSSIISDDANLEIIPTYQPTYLPTRYDIYTTYVPHDDDNEIKNPEFKNGKYNNS